jgi:hypothetical protein
VLIRARSTQARRLVRVLGDRTYLARMNLKGRTGDDPGGVTVRIVEC